MHARTGVAAVLAAGLLACATGCKAAPSAVVSARAHDPTAAVRALERAGWTVQVRATSADGDCVADSRGAVHAFLDRHRCTALFRALFDVRDSRGRTAVVAVAWVDLPGTPDAIDFRSLVDRGGSGNLTELGGARRFTGQHYASSRDGVTVVNAQAEAAGTAPTGADLDRIAGTAAS